MSLLTYCKLCNKDIIISHPIPEDNKDPEGYIVCKKCYWSNYNPEKIKSEKRNDTINKLLKKKWYKFW